ncbi:MAG: HD domain-containing protein [Deltaproteobacteria bacterium]|nr:HD domain-containing protein [Deltaproteobacteria bacterium]
MSFDLFRIQIRDPIHGSLHLSRDELALVDHPAFQRLRSIKQLGLADLAFPGATHTRYAHSLGVMHVASRMFESLAKPFRLEDAEYNRLLGTLRLAALFHDIGHPPLSHTSEAFMPPVSALELDRWIVGPEDRRANHEDYTLKILTDSELTRVIEDRFAAIGVTPEDIATLIAGRRPHGSDRTTFVVEGRDFMPLLRQCVSSELDADRMDYLLRDSYYAGVPYGRYDIEWLLQNLAPVERQAQVCLGLNARASFGFEDFLLSRYHMFMSVYFHHIPIGYEVMLQRFRDESPNALVVPANVEGYLEFDDVFLISLLRRVKSPWARRIVERRAFRMLIEAKAVEGPTQAEDRYAPPDIERVQQALTEKGIANISHSVKGRLSKYFSPGATTVPGAPPELSPFIIEGSRAIPVEDYVPLYRRYAGAIHLRRLYVDPERLAQARSIVKDLS